jgi:hypothetical protein
MPLIIETSTTVHSDHQSWTFRTAATIPCNFIQWYRIYCLRWQWRKVWNVSTPTLDWRLFGSFVSSWFVMKHFTLRHERINWDAVSDGWLDEIDNIHDTDQAETF